MAVIDEMRDLQVFYVNIGGGEPTIRPDFFTLVEYATGNQVGVKFSTNGSRIDRPTARRLAAMDYTDIQISLDGADAATNDSVRGDGSWATAVAAMDELDDAGFGPFKISVVMTRHNIPQLDDFGALAERYGAELRLTRLRPSGRAVDSWHRLHPTNEQQIELYHWLLDHPDVLTGDSFFHLNALGSDRLEGLNLCGAGRVPDRPRRRRLRLPLRAPRRVPGRKRQGGRRLHPHLALLRSLSRAPATPVGGSVRQLRPVRRLPGRLHGGQVLHRAPTRRPRSGVRQRARPGGTGRPRTCCPTPGRHRSLQAGAGPLRVPGAGGLI